MSFLSDFSQGFLVLTVVVGILNTNLIFVLLSHVWIAQLFLMIFLIPISIMLYTHLSHQKNDVDKLRRVLVSLNGVALACWVFDVGSTYYAIDILGGLGGAVEQNPLGWPFGALGPLIFYVPAFVFTYVLLFRIKQKVSLFAAILLTFLVLVMGSLNLFAGLLNFGGSPYYLAVILQIAFTSIILIVNISRHKRRGL